MNKDDESMTENDRLMDKQVTSLLTILAKPFNN